MQPGEEDDGLEPSNSYLRLSSTRLRSKNQPDSARALSAPIKAVRYETISVTKGLPCSSRHWLVPLINDHQVRGSRSTTYGFVSAGHSRE